MAGMYTSIHLPELGYLLDVGCAARGTLACDHLFLSHCHADHVGALPAWLGMRGMMERPPPTIYLPEGCATDLEEGLRAFSRLQRYPLDVKFVELKPGDTVDLPKNWRLRTFRTHHPVPSLGYHFERCTKRLLPEFAALDGAALKELRQSGQVITTEHSHSELSYATDTLIEALDKEPQCFKSRRLLMECSFLDEKKSVLAAQAGCHVHLDQLLERLPKFEGEHLVLMHLSQLYSPDRAREILNKRLPKDLPFQVHLLAPDRYFPF